MIESLVGVVIGFLLSLAGTALQRAWSRHDRLADERRQLVRELVRYRMNQSELALRINEIPVLFYDDDLAVDLYRQFVGRPGDRDAILGEILVHACKSVGLPAASRDDLQVGLYVDSPPRLPGI